MLHNGTKLRKAREAKGLTLSRCAELAGMNKGYLLRVERGERPVPLRYLSKLAAVLGPEVEAALWAGQTQLDFDLAERREDLDATAAKWLSEKAQEVTRVEVWQLGQAFLVMPVMVEEKGRSRRQVTAAR